MLPSHLIEAGDQVVCEVVPSDAYGTGESGLVAGIIQPVPLQSRIAKGTLALAGVRQSSAELEPVVERGMVATTGYVVSEIGQTKTVPLGMLAVLIAILVVVNANLLIRLRRRSIL
jgi:hypothetical protein